MPDASTLLLFALASLALTMTPGPDMLLIATRSVSQGRAAGFATLAGIQAGTYVHALAAALGLSQLFVAVPIAYEVVKWTGAAYLVFLAYQAFRAGGDARLMKPPSARHGVWALFRQGLFTNVLNPKMALFVLALFPQFIHLERGPITTQVLILATVLNVVGLVVNGAVIMVAGRLRIALSGASRFGKVARYALGMVFLSLAARVALARGR